MPTKWFLTPSPLEIILHNESIWSVEKREKQWEDKLKHRFWNSDSHCPSLIFSTKVFQIDWSGFYCYCKIMWNYDIYLVMFGLYQFWIGWMDRIICDESRDWRSAINLSFFVNIAALIVLWNVTCLLLLWIPSKK